MTDDDVCLSCVLDSQDSKASQKDEADQDFFYYFAYGSCMCPVDLQRSLGEHMHPYVVGVATLHGYRLGFFRQSRRRNCGVLDVVRDAAAHVQGVLYRLPMRVSDRLDIREEGYCHEIICVEHGTQTIQNVRTYTVIDKASREYAPNDWYFSVVMRGAVTCGLPEQYCWKLFHHMQRLQDQHYSVMPLKRAS
jgi:cation transport regulator ChaC